MHRCLLTPEIFSLILENLNNSRTYFQTYGDFDVTYPRATRLTFSRTILHLALTCKMLSEPALDTLWYHQKDLGALLKCFPEGTIRKRGVEGYRNRSNQYCTDMVLRRDIKDADLERVCFYSRRVRVLGPSMIMSYGEYSILPSEYRNIFPILYGKIRPPLFPNLEHLCLALKDFNDPCWCSSLASGPKLKSIRICYQVDRGRGVHYDSPEEKQRLSRKWANITSSLKPASSSLTNIQFTLFCEEEIWLARHDYEKFIQAPGVFQMINSFPEVTEMNLLSITMDSTLVAQIIGLERITKLSIHIPEDVGKECLSLPLKQLPRLQTLLLGVSGLGYPSPLIQSICPSGLRRLKVIVSAGGRVPEIHPFLQSLTGSSFSYSLESIRLVRPIYDGGSDADAAEVTIETIDILSSFLNLREIEISINGHVDLDSTGVRKIAKVWPQLESLKLQQTLFSIPRISLEDFITIVPTLGHLKEVELRINCCLDLATVNVVNVMQELRNLQGCPLWGLSVCTSPISEPSVVAALLVNAFPDLRCLDRGWLAAEWDGTRTEPPGMNEKEREYEMLWDEVIYDLLKGVLASR